MVYFPIFSGEDQEDYISEESDQQQSDNDASIDSNQHPDSTTAIPPDSFVYSGMYMDDFRELINPENKETSAKHEVRMYEFYVLTCIHVCTNATNV